MLIWVSLADRLLLGIDRAVLLDVVEVHVASTAKIVPLVVEHFERRGMFVLEAEPTSAFKVAFDLDDEVDFVRV